MGPNIAPGGEYRPRGVAAGQPARPPQHVPPTQRVPAPPPWQTGVGPSGAALLGSDDEDWDAVDAMVRSHTQHAGPSAQQTGFKAHSAAAAGPSSAYHMAAATAQGTISDGGGSGGGGPHASRQPPGEQCAHGVPLLSCPRREEHLAVVKDALLNVMSRLFEEEGALSAEEEDALKLEHRRLKAQREALQDAPPPPPAPAAAAAGAEPSVDRPMLPAPGLPSNYAGSSQPGPAQAQQQHRGSLPGGSAPYSATQHGMPQHSMPQHGSGAYGAGPSAYQAGGGYGNAGGGYGDAGGGYCDAGGGGERPDACHVCGEPGHWAASCPQRGAGGSGFNGGGFGGGAGAYGGGGSTQGASGGGGGYVEGEPRAPDPSLRGGAGGGAAPAVECQWREGTNDKYWSRQFEWSKVGAFASPGFAIMACNWG